jgi:hypothetical protein
VAKLGRENQVDAAILRNQLQSDIWNAEVLQSGKWDPQVYNGIAGSAIYGLMAREFAPLPERLKSATARMEKLPQIFAQARENLDPARVPKIHAETVAKQNKGILSIVDTFITPTSANCRRRPGAPEGRHRRPEEGRRRTADLAGQDPGAERQGRVPHRCGKVRPEAEVLAELLAVAPGDRRACTRRTPACARTCTASRRPC